jgi:hypothetical protein
VSRRQTPKGSWEQRTASAARNPSAPSASFSLVNPGERTTPLFDLEESAPAVSRLVETGEFRGVPTFVLDIPETIPKLGYGSHQFFRYYGKFPSVVGREIVSHHGRPDAAVLDCYAGCGTSLVEAQTAGYVSFGLDLNPLAVLACNVKTASFDARELRAIRDRVTRNMRLEGEPTLPASMPAQKLDKWFRPYTQRELSALRLAILSEPPSLTRQFVLLAFLGIVRRVSTAYDGEVRPHVNQKKKPRSATLAFVKKMDEMIEALDEVDALRPRGVMSRSIVGDNRDESTYRALLGSARPGLVIAHPPYLNSFNYFQVFSLEFAWSEDFEEVWGNCDLSELRRREHRAWPATNPALVSAYYNDFEKAMTSAAKVVEPGAKVAVVIGDATIRRRVERVHVRCWEILAKIGLRPVGVWYRTTHYGIGKYAYRHRADYHGDAEKRDAILFFQA